MVPIWADGCDCRCEFVCFINQASIIAQAVDTSIKLKVVRSIFLEDALCGSRTSGLRVESPSDADGDRDHVWKDHQPTINDEMNAKRQEKRAIMVSMRYDRVMK